MVACSNGASKPSPSNSRRWQLALAEQVIAPVGGQIVAVYHDIVST